MLLPEVSVNVWFESRPRARTRVPVESAGGSERNWRRMRSSPERRKYTIRLPALKSSTLVFEDRLDGGSCRSGARAALGRDRHGPTVNPPLSGRRR